MMEGGSEEEKSWNRIFNEEPPLRCPLECLPRRPYQLAYKSTSFTLLHSSKTTPISQPYKVRGGGAVDGINGLERGSAWLPQNTWKGNRSNK